jgi:hypothetical protein
MGPNRVIESSVKLRVFEDQGVFTKKKSSPPIFLDINTKFEVLAPNL